jgi:hypothetical protein
MNLDSMRARRCRSNSQVRRWVARKWGAGAVDVAWQIAPSNGPIWRYCASAMRHEAHRKERQKGVPHASGESDTANRKIACMALLEHQCSCRPGSGAAEGVRAVMLA